MTDTAKPAEAPKDAKAPSAEEIKTEIKLIQAEVHEEPAAPTTMQKVRQIIHENVLLQHLVFVPVVIVVSYFIGGIIVWPVFLGLSIYLSVKKLQARKQHVYDFFEESLKDDLVEEVQEVAWLNQIITKYYASCVPALVKPHIDNVSKTLSDAKPPFMVRSLHPHLYLYVVATLSFYIISLFYIEQIGGRQVVVWSQGTSSSADPFSHRT